MLLIYATIENLWTYVDLVRRLSKRELVERGLVVGVSLIIMNLLWPVAQKMVIAILQTFPNLPDKGLVYFCLLLLTILFTILACIVVGISREVTKKLHKK
jgi:hypothetical protein